MIKSKIKWLIGGLLLFGGLVVVILFYSKPLIVPSKLDREQINNLIMNSKDSEKKQMINNIADLIEQNNTARQRGLWQKLACVCSGEEAIKYLHKEIACWPKGTVNNIIVDSYRESVIISLL